MFENNAVRCSASGMRALVAALESEAKRSSRLRGATEQIWFDRYEQRESTIHLLYCIYEERVEEEEL